MDVTRSLAGDRARDVYANVDAARFYERALEASGNLKTLARRRARSAPGAALGEVRDAAGDYRGAVEAMKDRRRLLKDDPVAQARSVPEARARLDASRRVLRTLSAT